MLDYFRALTGEGEARAGLKTEGVSEVLKFLRPELRCQTRSISGPEWD